MAPGFVLLSSQEIHERILITHARNGQDLEIGITENVLFLNRKKFKNAYFRSSIMTVLLQNHVNLYHLKSQNKIELRPQFCDY